MNEMLMEGNSLNTVNLVFGEKSCQALPDELVLLTGRHCCVLNLYTQ